MSDDFYSASGRLSWGLSDGDTVSGPGSTLRYTEGLRAILPTLLAMLGCRSLLDAPCGDFNWMRAVPLPNVAYHGGDVDSSLVTALRTRFPERKFSTIDVLSDELPPADVWLCRDLLLHLSDIDIIRVLQNFLRSPIRYFASTHYFDESDFEAYFGSGRSDGSASGVTIFRFVNLMQPPFGMPAPDYILRDYVAGFPRRWLAVWDRLSLGDFRI